MKLLNPIFGVLDEKVAHWARFGSVKLDCIPPRRLVPAGKEIGCVKGQKIPFRTEMVVNDVKQRCDPALVSSLDESLEVLRSAVTCIRGVRKGSVIAPVPAALEVTDRHDLDGRDTEVREVVQLKSGSRKRALRRKNADMEFVKHHVIPFAARPGLAPAKCGWVYGLARTVYVIGLKARRRIGNLLSARQRKPITRPCRQAVCEDFEKAVPCGRHWDGIATLDHQRELLFFRRPQTEAYSTVFERRAVRPFQHAVFHFGGERNRFECGVNEFRRPWFHRLLRRLRA